MRSTSRLLDQLGYEVSAFQSPTAALAALAADAGGYDLVMTDRHMPELGGIEMARRVFVIRPDLPIVLVSGSRTSDRDLSGTNIAAHLDKPFSRTTLADVLQRVLAAPTSRT